MAMVGWHWGWIPAPRLRGGKLSTRGHGRGEMSYEHWQRDSSTPLRYTQNDML